MDKPWCASGSSSWPKTKKCSSKKKVSKRKTSSLPAVPSVSGVNTRSGPTSYHPSSAQPSSSYFSLSSLRGQGTSARPKSAHRSSAQQAFEAHPSRAGTTTQGSAYSPTSAHGTCKQVYYSSSFECLVDNLDSGPQAGCICAPKTTNYYGPLKIWTRSRAVRDVFQFNQLPTDCKLKIFSYFSAQEKGSLSSVCREWGNLMKTSSLWKNVDFTEFSFTCLPKTRHISVEAGVHVCFQCHRKRVLKFTKYLLKLRPFIKKLVFNYDICDTCDGWLAMLYQLLDGLPLRDLTHVQLKWKDTPMKPFGLDAVHLGDNDIVYRHRLRQRLFVRMFDKFTTLASNLTTLVLPFDWSEKSVEYLSRLKSLHSLVLEKYFVFQRLDQELLSSLLSSLPKLERLMLEVWTPSGHGLTKYHVQSESLRYLDISQSRGFYLQNLWLPNLNQFYVARHPWNGPLVQADKVNLDCLHGTLTTGAPKLQKLNDHVLHADWRCNVYLELEEALKAVCSCRRHKPGWAM